jgi:hypothetical protein
MKRDRFLIGIVIGIVVLIAVTVGLFFIRQGAQSYISDSTPEGVVHNYTLAFLKHDYNKAYGYLADLPYKPTLAEFITSTINLSPDDVALEIGETQSQAANTALVTVNVVNSTLDYSNWTDQAKLVLQDGQWKLSSMPNALWDYNWYQVRNP